MTPRPHVLHDALLSRVVGSAAFARARARSAAVAEDPAAMERLCVLAEEHLAALPGDQPPGVPAARLAAAVQQGTGWVREHAREVARGGPTHEQQGTLRLTRVRLLLAALDFFVCEDDVVPDHHRHGLLDDVIALEWALAGMARGGGAVRVG
ncbi:hypothetical protein [Kytococcus sedentarius]|uniref:hypothetical protein n=1 Tax=Kytococcus sedentarius TaxID=1276 RepID=UPI0035BC3838